MKQLLSALKAAGEPTRLRMLGVLARGELTVSELVRILRQSQPRVSRHLKLLAEAGLIERSQEGAWAFYRLADQESGGAIARHLVQMIPGDNDEFARDLERFDEIRAERQAEAEAYFRANAADWDRIRSLYVPERKVEAALLEAVDGMEIESLLDVGTGTGRMLELFANRIRRGVGVDLSRDMLGIARAKLSNAGLAHCHVRQGDMYALTTADNSFDAVVLHQVLHYADDPAAALAEAARTLRPGGVILIVDFAKHDLEFLRAEHAHRRLGFTDEEIKQWSRAAHMSVETAARLPGEALTVNLWKAHKAETRLQNVA